MTSNQVRALTAGYGVSIGPDAWSAIGKLSSDTFVGMRDTLLDLAARGLGRDGDNTAVNTLETPVTARLGEYSVTFRVDPHQKIVVLLNISQP